MLKLYCFSTKGGIDINTLIEALKTIYENSNNGIALIDGDLTVLWCNHVAIDIINNLEAGMKLDKALPSFQWLQSKSLMRSGKPIQMITSSARIRYNVLIQPFLKGDEIDYAIVHFSPRYVSGDLATDIILHDLKHPVNGILMVVGKQEGRDANAIRNYCNSLLALIKDLTSSAKGEMSDINKLDYYNLTVFVRKFFEECADILKSTVKVETDITDELMICRFDPHNLERVLSNLVVNAKNNHKTYIKMSLHKAGEEAVIEVKNDSEAIPEDIRDRLYEPSVKSDSSRGSGLGLYVAKSLTETFGGTLSFDDSDDVKFTVRLPLAAVDRVSSQSTEPYVDKEYIRLVLEG